MKHYPQKESAAHYFAKIEEDNERACFECAEKNGHTTEEAENCDNGSLNCKNCPFK